MGCCYPHILHISYYTVLWMVYQSVPKDIYLLCGWWDLLGEGKLQNEQMQKSYRTPWTHSQILEPENSPGILRLEEKRYALEYVCKPKYSHLLCRTVSFARLFLSVRQLVAFRGSWDVLSLWTISRAQAGFFSRLRLGTWRPITRHLLLHSGVTLGTCSQGQWWLRRCPANALSQNLTGGTSILTCFLWEEMVCKSIQTAPFSQRI